MFCLAISRLVTSPEEAMGRQGESLRVRTTLQRFSTVVVLNLWGHQKTGIFIALFITAAKIHYEAAMK